MNSGIKTLPVQVRVRQPDGSYSLQVVDTDIKYEHRTSYPTEIDGVLWDTEEWAVPTTDPPHSKNPVQHPEGVPEDAMYHTWYLGEVWYPGIGRRDVKYYVYTRKVKHVPAPPSPPRKARPTKKRAVTYDYDTGYGRNDYRKQR